MRCGGPRRSGWSLATFRLFYLAGAVLNVPWLALGTVYLLAGERDRRPGALVARAVQRAQRRRRVFAPTRTGVSGTELPTGKDVFGVAPRVLAAVGSGVAALVIIAGALWSVSARAPARACAAGCASQRIVAGSARRRQPADRRRHARAVGQRHARRRLGKDPRSPSRCSIGIVVLFAGFLVASTTAGVSRWSRYVNERRSSLPLTFRGSWSTNRIFDGHL